MKSHQARSFSSSSFRKQKGTSPTRCVCCSKNHSVEECDKFKEMTLTEREQVIKNKGLCKGCLKRSHLRRNCVRRQTCDVCRGQHPTILHKFKNEEPSPDGKHNEGIPNKEVQTTVTHSHCSNTAAVDEGECVSSILPVLVKYNQSDEILTYALLDEQSDACFMTDALKTKLGASGTNIKLEFATILDRGTVNSERLTGVTIRGLNQDEGIKLPATYTRECIPVTVSQIPTPETVNEWPHLQKVKTQLSPRLSVEVGLLIGATCPKALTPLEVIPGTKENDPYAVRTALGWGVIGVTRQGSETTTKKRFVFKSTTKEIIQVLERDFIDLPGLDQKMSVDDANFIKRMDEGVQIVDGRVQLPLPFKEQPQLQNNRSAAMKRLMNLKHKMVKKPAFAEKYKDFMAENYYEIEPTIHAHIADDDVEVRRTKVFLNQTNMQLIPDILKRVSSWTKAKRVIATCMIFVQKLKGVKRTNDITVEDLTRAENVIIKNSQESEFKDLNKLERLDPIKDEDNLIRVGGRLKEFMLPREIKHPVILPNKEAEATINSRPLCTTSDTSLEPLIPAHLLTLKMSTVYPPPGNFQRDGKFSRKLWRRVQHVSEMFWGRWRKEYVASLQQRQKWSKVKRNVAVGDIVLLCDEQLPRNQWELARVTSVKSSDDGLVRSVTLFVGRRKISLDRPISKIVVLIPEEEQ
ncbi:hypothetical protein HOLleu_18308 [Holothuria leucospilota]|uniref:DUF5641 domain-containing protein n=1 Tax=Holothuria leucospilota TaxID=206669 RepID=A0A9Q1H9J0_HOLLE|nr:hypothetical protein HOLleu_18308 [Holothuria leucospilota]